MLIHQYVAFRDGKEAAKALVKTLEQAARRLEKFPDRGHVLPELTPMGIRDVQEITNGPYRIIYKVLDDAVHVLACIDGRRDVEQLLMRRALRTGNALSLSPAGWRSFCKFQQIQSPSHLPKNILCFDLLHVLPAQHNTLGAMGAFHNCPCLRDSTGIGKSLPQSGQVKVTGLGSRVSFLPCECRCLDGLGF